jgi:hypothetical protein
VAKGVNIPITSDASDVISEGKKIEGALDKVIDSLDDIGDQAKTTDRVLDQEMGKIETSAKDASGTLERKFSESFDTVKREAKQTGDTVDRETREGTSRAGEATGEFKSEALQNFSEVSSSFSGDMTSAVDLVQGTLGGLAGSLPGVGIAFGLLGAAVGAVFGGMQTSAEETKQRISEVFDDLIANQLGNVSEALVSEKLQTLAQDAGKVQQAQDAAKRTGLDYGVVLRAMAGDVEAADKVTRSYDDLLAPHQQRIADLYGELSNYNDLTYQQTQDIEGSIKRENEQIDALTRQRSAYGLARSDLDKATEAQRAYNAGMEAGSDTAHVYQDRIDALESSISSLHDGQFKVEFLNYDQTYQYLSNIQNLLRDITGNKSLHIGRGLGGGGGLVI